ncbi:uncharacterized protein LOC126176829 [Schistocerca cancellata]|uniref:uncharacterized protein LOC126176829 n=1 Tax=Schistocerca cancellata TaxID=274614 RepID=UPI0021182763|nr:uncharacterized protein LOC126176829 [Schistocerca cancellata]
MPRGVCATESAARVASGDAFPGNPDGADRATRMDVDLRVRARRKLVQRATLARRGQGPAVALVSSGCRDLGEQATPRRASCGSAAAAAPRLRRPLPRLPLPFAHSLLSDTRRRREGVTSNRCLVSIGAR